MNSKEQLRRWVKGESVHNKETNECTPDLSCCRGLDWLAPETERKAFLDAYLDGDRAACKALSSKFIKSILNAEFPDLDIQFDGFDWGVETGQPNKSANK